MRRGRAIRLIRFVVVSVAVFASYAGLLCFPEPLFPYTVRVGSLVLHSDRPFPDSAGRHVLQLANDKLARSPLYSNVREHNIYICNARWRQRLFFNRSYGVGGVAPYPVTSNVFLRDAEIQDNRLISPLGTPLPSPRTLDYFIAHEVTHQITGEALGALPYFRLPQWVREGYADYVGKGTDFDYVEARRAFLADAPEMDWMRSGLYLRFHLLMAYLLDHRHLNLRQIFANPPSQAQVEDAIRREN